ncbi:hypothetical protein Hdeb2414_s0144g00812611 [Helianthus debilis subsp. tardiflorus]
MLHEYGIRSTFLQGINDVSADFRPGLKTSLCVPTFSAERRNVVLLVNLRYRILNKDRLVLLAKVEIRKSPTEVLTWVYNPVVYCKPKVGEVAEWVSFWPIGSMLNPGDEVIVNFYCNEKNMTVEGCACNLGSYLDAEKDNTMNGAEEIGPGGDLSEFRVAEGVYYLCRRNLCDPFTGHLSEFEVAKEGYYIFRDVFKESEMAETAQNLKMFFPDGVYGSDSQGWRKCRKQTRLRIKQEPENYRDTLLKVCKPFDISSWHESPLFIYR